MLLEMNISSSHVQNTFFLKTPWYGTGTRGVGSEVKFPSTEGGSVNEENPQQTFPVVIQVLSIWSFLFIVVIVISILLNCILTNLIS